MFEYNATIDIMIHIYLFPINFPKIGYNATKVIFDCYHVNENILFETFTSPPISEKKRILKYV